jgi:phosphomannomutase / phosphoglucomutase
MEVNKNIFRGYDIRGIVGTDLSPEIAEHIGKAYGTYLLKKGQSNAIIGRDFRETSPKYSLYIAKGLNWCGIDVIDIGMCLVGTFYWSGHHLKNWGGIYVSASHNPAEYNGFKLMADFSETLVSGGVAEIRDRIIAEDYIQNEKKGSYKEQDIQEAYFKDVLSRVPISKNFTVIIDPSNTTAGAIVPEVLKRAGCTVIEQNTKLDTSFPLGNADPTEADVARRLQEGVRKHQADVGFSFDSDGDRIGIVDEKGTIVWNDVLVAMFAIDILDAHPKSTIMYNTLCSKAVPETIEKYGGTPFMWRTGHSFLKKKNLEVKAAFIGELSGHFFFSKDFYNHDDGIFAVLRLLSYMSRSDKKVSEIVAMVPHYISSPEIKLYTSDDEKIDVIKRMTKRVRSDYPNAIVTDDESVGDGVRIDLPTAMFVIRYSQNGPYITIKFEAKTKKEYDELKKYISDLLHSYDEIDWSSAINVNTDALN